MPLQSTRSGQLHKMYSDFTLTVFHQLLHDAGLPRTERILSSGHSSAKSTGRGVAKETDLMSSDLTTADKEAIVERLKELRGWRRQRARHS